MVRPGLDQKPLNPPHKHVDVCPRCGKPGVLMLYAPDGVKPLQVHVVHRPFLTPCTECGRSHPAQVCVVGTWPPTAWEHTQPKLHPPPGQQVFPEHPDPPP
jgi:hypothetical protein